MLSANDLEQIEELIEGRPSSDKVSEKRRQAVMQSVIVQWFGRTVSSQTHDALAGVPVRCGFARVLPDVIVISHRDQFAEETLVSPPSLAVAIQRPEETLVDLTERCNALLRAGTPICWILCPGTRQAWCYSTVDITKVYAHGMNRNLIFGYVEDGFENDVEHFAIADLWAELDRRGL